MFIPIGVFFSHKLSPDCWVIYKTKGRLPWFIGGRRSLIFCLIFFFFPIFQISHYQCCVSSRISYRYLLVINLGIYSLTQWGWKKKLVLVCRTFILKTFEKFKKPAFVTISSLHVLSWQLSVLWRLWNTHNRWFSNSYFFKKIKWKRRYKFNINFHKKISKVVCTCFIPTSQ
jgi:hypothetical protein